VIAKEVVAKPKKNGNRKAKPCRPTSSLGGW
jgi:hypothetical protein